MKSIVLSSLTALVVSLVFGFAVDEHSSFASRKNRKISQFLDWTISSPQDQEVCFSPEDPCDVKLTKFIQSAEKSIDIAIYDINRDKLVHEILVASHKIPVRIVVDRRQAKGNHSLVPLLIKAGAQVRYGSQRGIMHNKFTIIDDKMIETGSFNYTNHASEANNENQLYLSNPKIVEKYKRRFEDLWENATPA